VLLFFSNSSEPTVQNKRAAIMWPRVRRPNCMIVESCKHNCGIPLTCSLGCFTKHFIEKMCYKMVLRQPTSRQQVGTLYEMTSPSSLWNASPQTTRVQRHAARHRATTQLSSIKCCSNLGVVFEALLQYGKTYVYKMPFPQAVANPSDLIHWRSDVQLVWL
jgi:hypothetical protein